MMVFGFEVQMFVLLLYRFVCLKYLTTRGEHKNKKICNVLYQWLSLISLALL